MGSLGIGMLLGQLAQLLAASHQVIVGGGKQRLVLLQLYLRKLKIVNKLEITYILLDRLVRRGGFCSAIIIQMGGILQDGRRHLLGHHHILSRLGFRLKSNFFDQCFGIRVGKLCLNFGLL